MVRVRLGFGAFRGLFRVGGFLVQGCFFPFRGVRFIFAADQMEVRYAGGIFGFLYFVRRHSLDRRYLNPLIVPEDLCSSMAGFG